MIKIFKRKKRIDALEAEVAESKREMQEVQNKNVKVDKLVKDLHKHLDENNFGKRLYLQMVSNWR